MGMNEQFKELLRQGLHSIKTQEGRNLGVIQDELGYELGREGGSVIQHWKRGYPPSKYAEFKTLATMIVRRGKLDAAWLEEFCKAAGFPFSGLADVFHSRTIQQLHKPDFQADNRPRVSKKISLSSVITLLADGDHQQAARLLFEFVDRLLQQEEPSEILALQTQFAEDKSSELPELWFVWGAAHSRLHHDKEAIHFLQKSRAHFLQIDDVDAFVRCCLELAQVHQRLDDFQTVQRYIHEIERVEHRIQDESIQIQFWICVGQVCHDIGRLKDTVTYFDKALCALATLPDKKDVELRILHLQSIAYRQLGQYHQAAAALRIARQIYEAGGIPRTTYPSLLNAEAHLHWYRGNLDEALTLTRELVCVCDEVNLSRHRLYSRILLGNLYTALRRYGEASDAYGVAEEMIIAGKYTFVQPWISAQQSWLHLVQGNESDALSCIWKAMEHADPGQLMSFNVTKAIIYSIQSEYKAAEEAFYKSLAFYEESGDYLTRSVIYLYLAHIHGRTQNVSATGSAIEISLSWLAERNILYFPNWWFPSIIGQVLIHAIEIDRQRPFAERMLVRVWRSCTSETKLFLKRHMESSSRSFQRLHPLLT